MEKCYLPPLLSEFLMLGFYELAGVPSPVAFAALPIFVLIHYLWRTGTHRPRNTHSTCFLVFAPTHKYFRVADILTVVNPHDLSASAAPDLCPLRLSLMH